MLLVMWVQSYGLEVAVGQEGREGLKPLVSNPSNAMDEKWQGKAVHHGGDLQFKPALLHRIAFTMSKNFFKLVDSSSSSITPTSWRCWSGLWCWLRRTGNRTIVGIGVCACFATDLG